MIDAKDYPNTIEFASEKVHNAWMDEKLKQGFHAPTNCPHIKPIGESLIDPVSRKFKNHCPKCHTDLYHYSELPENIKEYDRVTVIAVLNTVNYFEGKTCSDCGYFDPEMGVCFGGEIGHSILGSYPICETFAPRGLVEESP